MAGSSSSDPLDLEKQEASTDRDTVQDEKQQVDRPSRHSCTSFESRKQRDCEGWAAAQDSLAPVCSRINSRADAAQASNICDGAPDDDDGANSDGTSIHETPSVMNRVLSRITSKSSVDPGPPPDGGVLAWTQCRRTHHLNHPTLQSDLLTYLSNRFGRTSRHLHNMVCRKEENL